MPTAKEMLNELNDLRVAIGEKPIAKWKLSNAALAARIAETAKLAAEFAADQAADEAEAEAAEQAAAPVANGAANGHDIVTVKQLAHHLNLDPRVCRAKLRTLAAAGKIPHTAHGRWVWNDISLTDLAICVETALASLTAAA